MIDSHRVFSGMRPTGALHFGHYHGVLKNWLILQNKYPCFFSIVDLHALTTHYNSPEIIQKHVWDVLLDWLAAGIDPNKSTLFIQSWIPEHAELALLLGMNTPLNWLERIPTYKKQENNIINTYGFLGYPVLMSADILLYKAKYVPVGEDQAPHLEYVRELACRFNYIYNKEHKFKEKISNFTKKLDVNSRKLYLKLHSSYREKGNPKILKEAYFLLHEIQNLSIYERNILLEYIESTKKNIFPEPQMLLTKVPYVPGTNGQKMSKSYGNTIGLRENKMSIEKKIRAMITDPARIRRIDPGNPKKCPVWKLHNIYSDNNIKEWVYNGCNNAMIGCVDCKQPIIESIIKEQHPMLERVQPYLNNTQLLQSIVANGYDKARVIAKETIREVREVMGINYR